MEMDSCRGKVNEPCRRFNRGKCNYGANCRYKHRCSYCFKFGHTLLNCRKAISDRDRKPGGGGGGDHHRNDKNDKNNPGGFRGNSQNGQAQVVAQESVKSA